MDSHSNRIEHACHVWPQALPVAAAILFMLVVLSAACTYLKPISADAETLQQQIRSGEAVRQGDHVRVVTQDGVSRRLTVASVEDDMLKGYLEPKAQPSAGSEPYDEIPPEQLQGPLVDIPIGEIVLLEKETTSKGKTAAAVGGGIVVFLAIGAAMAFAAVMAP
jgi:hypothetical protein